MSQISHKSIVLDTQNHLEELRKEERPRLRPPVKPVIARCGHIGRSTEHTCGRPGCALY